MIRRPPRSTLDRSSAASDVYKRQDVNNLQLSLNVPSGINIGGLNGKFFSSVALGAESVSYTHLRAHETVLDLVCRLLLEKKKITVQYTL